MRAGTDHTVFVAVLAALTALAGASVAAISAGMRQRSQLRHEEMRQRNQLEHDRDLKDLAELRSVLDDAAVAFKETIHQCHSLLSQLSAWVVDDQDADVHATLERIYREGFRKELDRVAAGRDRMIVAGQRIAIRLGPDEPLYRTYQAAVALVIDVLREVVAEDRRRGQAIASASTFAPEELNSRLGELERSYVDEALALVGSHLLGRSAASN